jgi:hypothetical protein
VTLPPVPDKPLKEWSLAEVETIAADEPVEVMPGTGRQVYGPRRRLLTAMREQGVGLVGDLEGGAYEAALLTFVARRPRSRAVASTGSLDHPAAW